MDNKNLKDKVIIVAGGAGGIGTETCLLLASHGVTIVLANRRYNRVQTILKKIQLKSPNGVSFEADLSLSSSWKRLVDHVVMKFNRIDALVNCVGLLVPGQLERLHESDVRRVIGANIFSVIYGIQAVLPIMKRQGAGHIVTVGSLGGIIPMPFETLYSATKFAVRGLSLSLNEELKGTGIHVSHIAPAAVHTQMLITEAADDRSSITFASSPLEPRQIAESIVGVLQSHKREMILPRRFKTLAVMLNFFPKLFAACYPIFDFLGSRRLKNFKENFLPRDPSLLQVEQ